MKIIPSHVALLVPSTRKAAEYLKRFDFEIGKEETWDGEGTLEIYVGRGKGNSLLLMEPAKPGAYRRALEKRGPGLHHLAIDVLNLEEYIDSISGSGWLLHPKSLKMIKAVKTAYLARPGFPGLIEVQQNEKLDETPLFVSEVSVPIDAKLSHLLKPIGLEGVVKSSSETHFTIGGKAIKMRDLI